MGLPQPTSTIGGSTHMYSQALQVKLYQAFIFSIPILFSIILFLLFYLFYLKRRSSVVPPPPPPILPTTFNDARPFISSPCEMDLKGELQEKLPKVVFDEDLRERDSLCCVCLGEFEMKEELVQVPSCKHLFHVECINHWLQSNTTCPLCRSSVLVASSDHHSKLLIPSNHQINNNSFNNQQHHQQQLLVSSSVVASTIRVETPSPSTSSTAGTISSSQNEMDQPLFALHIHVQNS